MCGCWEAWKSYGCCVGSLSACLDGQTMQGKGLCRKQEGSRKHHTPVFVRSQNESVPPLVPRLSGISVKDSWLLSSPVSTYLPGGSTSTVLLSAVGSITLSLEPPKLKTLALWIKGALYTLWELWEVDFSSHNNPGTSRLLGMLFFLFLPLLPGCFIALRVCVY